MLELYISYEDLGIADPAAIKLCFNYNNVSAAGNGKSNTDNYLVNGTGSDAAEEDINAYFDISALINP